MRLARSVVICVLMLLSASAAFAQEEKGTVAASYAILHDSEISQTFPTGWIFAAAGNMGRNLAVVGEIGGSYKTMEVLGTDVNMRAHSFLGGVRFMHRTSAAVPFAQVLAGAVNLSASALGVGDNSTEFAIQPGGGVDYWLTKGTGVRVQGDFRMIRSDGETTNQFRFGAGVVFAFGR